MKRNPAFSAIYVFFVMVYCISLSGSMRAQDVLSYSVSDGLAHNHISALFHDRNGYLWTGTWDGLSRFDGHSFTTYKNDPSDTTSILNDQILIITQDSTGQIWILGRQGLVKYLPGTDNFQRVYFRGKNDNSNQHTFDVCFDKKNLGWLSDNKGLISFQPDLGNVRFIDISDIHKVRCRIIPDDDGLYITSWKGLFHFTSQTLSNQAVITAKDADKYFLFEDKKYENPVFEIFQTSGHQFFLITSKLGQERYEMFLSDNETFVLNNIPIPKSSDGSPLFQFSSSDFEISPGKILLISDYFKTVILNSKTKNLEFGNPTENLTIKPLQHQLVYRDKQANLWFGGLGGLQKYSLPQLHFETWLYEPDKPGSISGRALTAIFKDRNQYLWVGSRDGGLDRIDLSDNSVLNIKLPPELRNITVHKSVFNIAGLNDTELLINIDSAIFRYQPAENRFSIFKIVDYHVYGILKDRDANLWISDRNHLLIGNPADNYMTFKSIHLTDFLPVARSTRGIHQDKKGQIWLACGDGLVKFDVDNPKASKIFVAPGSETDPEVFCIHETKNGTFWIGTIRNGIYAFDPGTEKFTAHYSTNEGLIDNSVNVIFEDKTGKLWMSTWKGISTLHPETGKIENFSTVNGLPFPEFNTNAHFLDEDGTMYFGGEGGMVSFHPDSFVKFNPETPLVINAIAGEEGLMALNYPLKGGESVKIPNTQSLIEISYSALDYRHPEERIYRYRLHGFQDDWKTAKPGNLTATFAGLSPGLYIFEVQSTYLGWPWNNEETKVFINIEAPPFYQRQVFLLMMVFAFFIALVMVIILRMRNKTIQKEMEITHLEKQANQSTLNFLKSQMNPHFYFNTLNAINSYILQNDIRSANKYLATFAKLMREILENSQKDFVTVSEEKEVLQKYLTLQRLRFPNIFDFYLDVAEDVLPKKIPPMLLQPFVENSVEYAFVGMTDKGEIVIRFKKQDNQIIATITDNGIGTEKSMKLKTQSDRKSTAIKNIHSRISVLNKIYSTNILISISPYSRDNIEFPGTIVTLTFPDFDHLQDKFENSKTRKKLPENGIIKS